MPNMSARVPILLTLAFVFSCALPERDAVTAEWIVGLQESPATSTEPAENGQESEQPEQNGCYESMSPHWLTPSQR